MRNAKAELIQHLTALQESKGRFIPIKCATIRTERNDYWDDNDSYISSTPIILKEGYSVEEYKEFLEKLDFNYDSGYGLQELFGTIWLTEEGCWYERGEYDGSEWWSYQECPSIPDNLKA